MSNGIRVRRLMRQDVEPLRDSLAAGAFATTTRRLFPRSLPSMLDWYDQVQHVREMAAFAIVDGAKFVGYCALRPPIFSGRELAIAIFDPGYHGRGIGRFAVTEMCRFGFSILRLPRIELSVYPTHHRAISCYSRCGFRDEAVLRRFLYHEGAWVDVLLMSLLRLDWVQQQKDA